MLSSGQLLGHEEREPISPAIPGEGIYEIEFKNKRTNVVRLLLNGFQERKLKKLANILLCCTTPRRAAQRSLPRPASRGRPRICAMNMLYMNAFIIISLTILANFPAVTYSPNIPFIAEKTPSTLHLDPNLWIPDHALGSNLRCSMTACFLAGLPRSSARSRS